MFGRYRLRWLIEMASISVWIATVAAAVSSCCSRCGGLMTAGSCTRNQWLGSERGDE